MPADGGNGDHRVGEGAAEKPVELIEERFDGVDVSRLDPGGEPFEIQAVGIESLGSGGCVPQNDAAVCGARGQPAAIRAECNCVYLGSMTVEIMQLSSGR